MSNWLTVYDNVAPATGDAILIRDADDSGATKHILVQELVGLSWEESSNTLQPKVAGYNIGAAGNEVGILDLQDGSFSSFTKGIRWSGGANISASGSTIYVRTSSGTEQFAIRSSGPPGACIRSGAALSWANTINPGGATDLALYRAAAGILAQRNGSNAQALRLYNLYTDGSTNEEWLELDWQTTPDVCRIATATSGGTVQPLLFPNLTHFGNIDGDPGAALSVFVTENDYAATIRNAGSAGINRNGLRIRAGVTTGDFILRCIDREASNAFIVYGDRSSKFFGPVSYVEQSSDPTAPSEGEHVIWQSDGTGSGDDGDIMLEVTAGAATKTVTLYDHSAATIGKHAYASIYVTGGSTPQPTNAVADTFDTVTGFATDGEALNATAASASDKITITNAGKYMIGFACSFQGDSGGGGEIYTLRLNGSTTGAFTQCQTQRKTSSTDVGSCGFTGIIDAAAEDLTVEVACDAISKDFTPTEMNLSVTKID